MSNVKVLFIVGQTASGKSGLAMKLAADLDGELICADSLTVYKGLDIGTAKPSAEDQKLIKHHLLDVANEDNPFTVANFQELAEEAIRDITSRGKLPIVVGGSGLYVDSLLFNYKFGPAQNKEQREVLEALTIEELQQIIVDNNYEMPQNKLNKRYLVRAIEQLGVRKQDKQMRQDSLVIGLKHDKDFLETRIRQRLKEMLKNGLIDEVKWAYKTYGTSSEALKGNIYQVLRPYLEQEEDFETASLAFIRQDLRLAKKQISWWKRNPKIIWFSDPNEAYNFVRSRL